MDLEDYKKQVVSLTNKFAKVTKKPVHDKQTSFFHLVEEVGEVGELLRHEVQNTRKFSKDKLSEELADVILWSVFLSNEYDIDISDCLQSNLDKIKTKIDNERLKNSP